MSADLAEIQAQYELKKAEGETRGAAMLARIEAFLIRFVAYPSAHAVVAHVLWIVHTHAMAAWESTPRIAFLSPEPASGKTRALEVSELLVPRPIEAVNTSPAYLFRKVSDPDGLPTILFDEIDTVFGPKAKKDNEEIRGMLNAGHRRGAVAGRCTVKGKKIITEELPAYCAVALAGLGNLPDTLMSRSIPIPMRRRSPTETVEPFRRRIHAPEGEELRDFIADWAALKTRELEKARPEMPEGIADRAADIWEPLLAIADTAGGDWPRRARVSAVTLVTDSMRGASSLGIRLLTDLKVVFDEAESLFTNTLLERLHPLDESPWGDLKGKPLSARTLSNLLSQYGIEPTTVRERGKDKPLKGYRRADFHDAWTRYVGGSHKKGVTSVTPDTNGHCQRCQGEGCDWCES